MESETPEEEYIQMSPLTKWILISLLTLPVILIFILLIKKPRQPKLKTTEDEDTLYGTSPSDEESSKANSKNRAKLKASKDASNEFKDLKINTDSKSIYDKFFKPKDQSGYPFDDELL